MPAEATASRFLVGKGVMGSGTQRAGMAIRSPPPGAGERDWDRYAAGQHDRTLSCRRPVDQIKCEFPARTASKARTESIGDLLRERSRAFSPRLACDFGGCFDELLVGDAIAQADVHGSATSIEWEANCKWE